MTPATTLQDLLLIRDCRNTPIPSVAAIWKSDALRKNWTVPLHKLSASDIYALSKPPPNWDSIDPYSGLEEQSTDTDTKSKDGAITSATVDTKVSVTNNTSSGTTSEHHYQFGTRNHTWPGLCRTVRTRNSSVICGK